MYTVHHVLYLISFLHVQKIRLFRLSDIEILSILFIFFKQFEENSSPFRLDVVFTGTVVVYSSDPPFKEGYVIYNDSF